MIIADHLKLKLEYRRGFGAWTYHIRIPDTKDLPGKWGSMKVSGFIDSYEVKGLNLAPRKNEDKLISINQEIRTAIDKGPGELVEVTLDLQYVEL